MKNKILLKVKKLLEKTEKSGNIDSAVFTNMRDMLKTEKDKWLGVKSADGFYFYQAIRNVEFVLEEMERRFKSFRNKHDYKKLAVDTLNILPRVDDILETAHKDLIIDEQSIDRILTQTYTLRTEAENANLLKAPDIDDHKFYSLKELKQKLNI